MDAMRSASSFFGLLTRLLTGYAHILAQPLRERHTLTRPGVGLRPIHRMHRTEPCFHSPVTQAAPGRFLVRRDDTLARLISSPERNHIDRPSPTSRH